VREGTIEVQGDHRDAVARLLAKEGLRGKLAGG
jgi:translation initiation factor 1 (eIF-1/SUI1)